jgi:hypothetical protein
MQNSSISNFKALLRQHLLPVAIACIAISFVIDFAITEVLVKNGKRGGPTKIYKLTRGVEKGTIPIIGSSRALMHIIGDSLNPKCYNYGIIGTGHHVHYYLMKEIIEQGDTTPIIFNLDFYGRKGFGFGDIANYLPSIYNKNISEAVSDTLSWYHRIGFVRYIGFVETYLKTYLSAEGANKLLNNGSEVSEIYTDSATFYKETIKEFKPSNKLKIDVVSNMEELFKMAPNRKFILVMTPIHPSALRKYNGEEVIRDYYNSLSKKHSNVIVFDYLLEPYTWNYWTDPFHLNAKGAKAFSSKFKADLHKALPKYF